MPAKAVVSRPRVNGSNASSDYKALRVVMADGFGSHFGVLRAWLSACLVGWKGWFERLSAEHSIVCRLQRNFEEEFLLIPHAKHKTEFSWSTKIFLSDEYAQSCYPYIARNKKKGDGTIN